MTTQLLTTGTRVRIQFPEPIEVRSFLAEYLDGATGTVANNAYVAARSRYHGRQYRIKLDQPANLPVPGAGGAWTEEMEHVYIRADNVAAL